MVQPVKKILIIRFSSIGDMVLTTPLIRCLYEQLPGVEIHYLTKPVYAEIMQSNPYVSKVQVLDKHPVFKAAELKAEHYDYVIDLHNNLRTRLFKAVLDAPSAAFPKLNIEKFMLVYFKVNTLPRMHIVDRYFKAAQALNIHNDGKGLDYFIPANQDVQMFGGLDLNNQKYIAWAIGAQHFTKRLPNHKIIEACRQITAPIILLGGLSDGANAAAIQAAVGSNCINACGVLSLHQSAAIIKKASHIFSNDTGLMHIAAAFKKPVTSFWGNTIPAFGMYPYYGNHNIENHIIQNNTLACRPCSKIGYNACPRGHFKCMEDLPVSVL